MPGTLQFVAQVPCVDDWPAVSSDFAGGANDGWSVEGDADRVPSDEGIAAKDRGEGIWWYWLAPPKFLGDHASSYGSSLSYSMRVSDAGGSAGSPMVTLEGAGVTIAATAGYEPGTDWTDYCYRLEPSGGWLLEGTSEPPTEQQMRAVLGNLTAIRIRGEYSPSRDVGALGSVWLGAK